MPGWKGAREAERRMIHTSRAGISVTTSVLCGGVVSPVRYLYTVLFLNTLNTVHQHNLFIIF